MTIDPTVVVTDSTPHQEVVTDDGQATGQTGSEGISTAFGN